MSPAIWVAIIGGSATIIGAILAAVFFPSDKQKQKQSQSQSQNQLNNQSTVVNVNVPKSDQINPPSLYKEKLQVNTTIIKQPAKVQSIDTTPKIAQHGKNNLVIGGDNKGNVNVGDTYNRPPQRHLQPEDIENIIKQATSKEMRIKICSDGSKEGNVFKAEFLKALFEKGYTKLSDCSISMSHNVWKESRITIQHGEYSGEKYLEVLLNPQE